MNTLRRADRWLFAPGDPRRLAGLRAVLAGVLALRLSRSLYDGLAGQSHALFRPVSFMRLLPAMPPARAVIVLQVVGVAAAVAAAVGLWTRAAFPVALACGLVLNGMASSLGVVVHNDSLLMLCCVPVAFSAGDAAWALRPRGHTVPSASARFGWPVRTSMVLCAGAYFFAGFAKFTLAGPAWITSGNLRWLLYQFNARSGPWTWSGSFIADHAWLTHVVAAAAVAIEVGFPLILWKPRLTVPMVAATLLLHAGIWATMHIDYWAQAATVVAVFADWPALAARATARRARATRVAVAASHIQSPA